jgi:hypothetical protein
VAWNQLPEGVIRFSPVKIHIFSKRFRKVITKEGKESEVLWGVYKETVSV